MKISYLSELLLGATSEYLLLGPSFNKALNKDSGVKETFLETTKNLSVSDPWLFVVRDGMALTILEIQDVLTKTYMNTILFICQRTDDADYQSLRLTCEFQLFVLCWILDWRLDLLDLRNLHNLGALFALYSWTLSYQLLFLHGLNLSAGQIRSTVCNK